MQNNPDFSFLYLECKILGYFNFPLSSIPRPKCSQIFKCPALLKYPKILNYVQESKYF